MKKSTEDRIEGTTHQVKGEIKQETGRITRNRTMQAKGMVEKNFGKAQRVVGRLEKKSEA